MNKKKKILTIILVIVVLLLAGASIYVATQLSTKQAVAPNAPTSKPAAADCTSLTTLTACDAQVAPDCAWYVACSKCANNGTAISTVCPEWVGSAECTLTGTATESVSGLTYFKEAFRDDPSNTAGVYKHTNAIKMTGDNAKVTPGETFVYYLWAKNSQTATVSGTVTFSDVLTGENLDSLSFVDSGTGCTYVSTSRTVTCTLDKVKPGTWGRGFRVKVADGVMDGTVIKNTFTTTHESETGSATTSVTVSNTDEATMTGSKKAYKNLTDNSAGSYTLSTEMGTVSKGQTYVYAIVLENTGDIKATGVTIKDTLASSLTFVDAVNSCSYNSSDRVITCNTTIDANTSKTLSYRVKAADSIVNGEKISNSAKITYNGDGITLGKELLVSTVVGCNHTCTSDDECNTSLSCDSTTNKCRLSACVTEDDCSCAIISTSTPAAVKTVAPTKIATAAATPTILPETGILDLPGVAAFGGGLILAVVGILLAL